MMERLSELVEVYGIPFAKDVAAAIAIFIVGRWAARLIKRAALRVAQRANLDESLRKFLGDLLYAVLLLIVIISSLEQLGVQTTAAIAVLGAAGLAIGLSLQDSLKNFAAGVLVILFRPYRVGHVITAAGFTGKVEIIEIFNTILVTGDNQRIIVPNGQIVGSAITNITANDTRRLDLVVGVGYDDDIRKAKAILLEILHSHDKTLEDPAPVVAVSELGESSINFFVRPWCKTEDYWTVRAEILETIKLRLDAEGISIPYPQRDVHLHQVAA